MDKLYRPFLFKITKYSTLFVAFATGVSFASSSFWLFSIFQHFRLQYVIVSLLLLFFFIVKRKKRLSSIALICLAINFSYLRPILSEQKTTVELEAKEFSVMEINLLTLNKSFDEVIKLVSEGNPDLLVLIEMTPRWEKGLVGLFKVYPYHKKKIRTDTFGLAVLSRFSLEKMSVEENDETPVIKGEVPILGKNIFVMAIHPPSPHVWWDWKRRNKHVSSYEKEIVKNKNPYKVVIGDFNFSRLSNWYEKFVDRTKLIDSAQGEGLLFTWPSPLIFPFGIKLDFIFHSKLMGTKEFRIGNHFGSDHKPVFARLGFLANAL